MDNPEVPVTTTKVVVAATADSVPQAPAKVEAEGRKVGRPKKRLPANKPGPRKGDAAILAEYRERMLKSPKSRKVLKKVFEIALNDDHAHQGTCLKMVMDRIIPAAALATTAASSGGKSAITINITGIGQIDVEGDEPEVLDADFEELD